MAKFFIHRPIFAIVISIIIVIVGVLAGLQLPIAQYPQIAPPTISVSTSYVGANASTVDETIAQIIEQKVNTTQGMDYMSSNSGDDGSYRLSVVFNVGTDGDMDAVKVQNNVAGVINRLPADVQSAGVTTVKSSSDNAMIFALYCENGKYSRTFIKNYADIYLLDKIQRVEGVGNVQVFGADYAIRVWLNPEKLASYNLVTSDIISAIKKQNAQAAAGTIGTLPANQGQEKQYTGKIYGRLSTPEEFADVIIKSDRSGSLIRLKDVARVEVGAKDNSTISKFNGHPSIGFSINLTSDANAMETLGEIKEILKEAREDFPDGILYGQVLDSTEFIEASLEEVIETFVEALILVVLVIFVFLQSWRATIIPLLAVPVSLIGTLGAFVVLDFTINTLTLFAMVLAIGLVVDDAIVVIENVEQHMETDHLSPVEATEKAMAEVQGPVVAIAFVLAAVFIPVAFLGGMMGVLYRQFALTIAVSMGLSAFIALTLTPALCAMILKPHDPNAKKGILDKFFDAFNNAFDRTKNVYVKIVAGFIKRSKFAILFMLIICGLTGFLYKIIPSTFVPSEDQGYFMTGISLPEGTSLNHTSEAVDNLTAAMLKQIPEIQSIMSVGGFDIMSGGAKSSGAVMFVGLKNWSERTEKTQSVSAVTMKTMAIGKAAVPEGTVLAINPPALPGLGSVGGLTMQLQDMSEHTDKELFDITNKIVLAANQRPELTGVSTTFSITAPSYEYEINRERVEMLGVSLGDVYSALQVNFGGMAADDFNRFGRTYKVMLQSDVYYRSEVDTVKFMFVRSSGGKMIPLDTLITPKLNTGTMQISRFNAKRAIAINGRAASGYSSGQAMAALEEVIKTEAPEGFNIEWSGQSREEKNASGSTTQVLGLALVFVFLCLAALYESWSVPYAVLLTVPTGIFGALVSEYGLLMLSALSGTPNPGLQDSVYMQIGIIMIMGLAAKNAILIVEFAKVRTDAGMDAVKAALESAELRLRPILMTSFAFIIGCLPLAVATGAGSAARNGMGVAVVGGMLFATSLGIFLIPVFFVIVQYIAEKFKKPVTKNLEKNILTK